MIRFTRLRLSGFKSFVENTEVPIEPGVTGIVGPNGCGKSNLVEALIWVMGESSARQLRGGEMDDVIFAGTASRASRNFAEVAMVLDNEAREAPAAFNDNDLLEVSRRIERDKFSTYKVNGREVRARDVQTLFADAASGSRSPAFITQGKVGQMINARPADRRGLLEDAAGIGGLAARRHEAELRLRSAETNLTRLMDVMGTLTGQVGGLRRQAKQAQRYREISTYISKAEAKLLAARWAAAKVTLEETQARLVTAEAEMVRLTGAAAAAATLETEAAAALPPLRAAESEAAGNRQRAIAAREALEQDEARLAVALKEVARQLDQIEGDRKRESTLTADATAALTRLEAEQAILAEQTKSEPDALAAAEQAEREAAEGAQAAEAALNQALSNAAAAEATRSAARRAVTDAEGRRNALINRAGEIARQIAAARTGLVPDERLPQLAAEVAAAQAIWEAARQAVETADHNRETTRQTRDRAREAAQAASATASALKAEIAGLTAALAGGQARTAAKPILEAIVVTPGLEAALGAALGEDLSVPEEAGEAMPVAWRKLPPLALTAPLPAGCEPLASQVEAPAALARRLSQIGVVADLAAGNTLQPSLLPGQRLVSKDGHLWRWDGLVQKAGGASTASAARLRQRNRLRELEPKYVEAEAAAAEAVKIATFASSAAEAATAAERQAHDTTRRGEAELTRLRQALAKLSESEATARSRLAGLTEQESAVAGERDAAVAAVTAAQEMLATLPPPDTNTGPGLRTELSGRHAALVAARGRREQLRHESDGRRRRLEAIAGETLSWKRQSEAAERQRNELAARQATAETERERLAALPAQFNTRRADLDNELGELEGRRRRAASALSEAEAIQTNATRARRDVELALGNAREEGVRRSASRDAANSNLELIQQAIIDKFGLAGATLHEAEGSPEPGAIQELERRHDRLIRERDDVGAVNLRAETELSELETQITTLTTEHDDLVAAIAKLRSAIAEINREGRERLLASFQEVDKHFRELFTRLFGGGRAQLTLTESDDPLLAGLEIIASPPGKKLQTLSLLSGGEQALTALSLLFAVFMTNPAPICVLDEVDAPLDDANVDRFCTLVSEIAERSQTRFLVVTHHRMTMARVDRLIGVTMMERGVSTLVSVDLEAAERLTEPA